MIIYSPLDGDALTSSIPSNPRHCFLMTRLGDPVPAAIEEIRLTVSDLCSSANYTVIDARSRVTGRDFLMKIWRLIASAPLSIGICHEVFCYHAGQHLLRARRRAGARQGDSAHQVSKRRGAKRFHQKSELSMWNLMRISEGTFPDTSTRCRIGPNIMNLSPINSTGIRSLRSIT